MKIKNQTYFLLFACFMLLFPLSIFAQDTRPIRQWATDANATSEYGPDNWSADQATGPPDSRECADAVTAWASETVSMSDALTVFYDTPVFATQVGIFQNYNPGAIVNVDLLPADGSDPIDIPESFDPGTPCPGTFTLDFEQTSVPIFGVRIWLEQSLIGDWNEIDAVQLVGVPADVEPVDVSAVPPAVAQPDGPPPPEVKSDTLDGPTGITVNCEGGVTFNNGVGVTVVQMRTGFNYTATAIGLDGFDPVLAVIGQDGTGLCTDDDANAASYSASLPTTGLIQPAATNSQVSFANNSNSAFADIELVVGGFNDQPGEFLLILEGMTFSSADNAGDAFSVEITPGLAQANVLSAYVISVTSAYDPTIGLIDTNYDYLTDDTGLVIGCDDAGNPGLCWGESAGLGSSYVSRTQGRQLGGGPLDPMLTIPLDQSLVGGFLNFIVNGAQNTYGDYVMVFHLGTR